MKFFRRTISHLPDKSLDDLFRIAKDIDLNKSIRVLLNVGAASFYRDPTHKTPLHPQLLEFLVSSAGFDSIELKFLHPSSEVPFQLPASLKDDEELKRLLDHVNSALLGPEDYSIIAFKSPLQ